MLIGLPISYLVGTISAQEKDAASNLPYSLGIRRDLQSAWRMAWSSRRSAEFVYRSIAWAALAIAATLLVSVLPVGCSEPAETTTPAPASQTPGGAATLTVVEETITPTNTPAARSSDRAALVALYNATDGTNWYVNDNWLSDAPLGEWHGVITDYTGHVIGLELAHNRLAGAIPAELGSLINLMVLQLSGNKLTGDIPAELGNLGNLERFHLSGNQLDGAIPAELEKLIYLTDFHLRGNNLIGCVPSLLYNASNNDLARLGLPPCYQASAMPSHIDRTVLVALYNATDGENWKNKNYWLSDAPLDKWYGVTTTLDGRVIDLSLDGNQLSGAIPSKLSDLTNLEMLNLGDNQLTGEIPSKLGNLSDLQVLNLRDNQLTGEIPAELGNLTDLRELYISHRSHRLHISSSSWCGDSRGQLVGEIPAELGNLANLRTLDLRCNQLSGNIPAELGDLANLGRPWIHVEGFEVEGGLGLSSNQLSGEIPAELGDLANLGLLNLSDNQLTGEIPAELGNLSSLESLDLGGNQLMGEIPAELGNLANLERLHLGSNQLTGEIPASLGSLTDLDSLDLSSNQLTGTIPAELGKRTRMVILDLRNNQLSGEIPAELGNLTGLFVLDISGNPLTGCIPSAWRNIEVTDLVDLGLPFCN